MKKTRIALLGIMTIFTSLHAMDETTPLDRSTPTKVQQVQASSNQCCGCGPQLPDWFDSCFGPVVTNIKTGQMDPYWVNSMSPLFQEIYENGMEDTHKSIIRAITKPCIFTRTLHGREERYNPILHWGALGAIPVGLAIAIPTALVSPDLGIAEYLIGGGSAIGCVGCLRSILAPICAKINYKHPTEG